MLLSESKAGMCSQPHVTPCTTIGSREHVAATPESASWISTERECVPQSVNSCRDFSVSPAGEKPLGEEAIHLRRSGEFAKAVVGELFKHLGGRLDEGDLAAQPDQGQSVPIGLINDCRREVGEDPAGQLDRESRYAHPSDRCDVTALPLLGVTDAPARSQKHLAAGQELGHIGDLSRVDPADRAIDAGLTCGQERLGSCEYLEFEDRPDCGPICSVGEDHGHAMPPSVAVQDVQFERQVLHTVYMFGGRPDRRYFLSERRAADPQNVGFRSRTDTAGPVARVSVYAAIPIG
jgi:hypothetical protein